MHNSVKVLSYTVNTFLSESVRNRIHRKQHFRCGPVISVNGGLQQCATRTYMLVNRI